MTAAQELAALRARLTAKVAEWRKWVETHPGALSSDDIRELTGEFATEIEALLTPEPPTVAEPPDYTPEQLAALEEDWNRILTSADRNGWRVVTPDLPTVAEPVFAYGERER